MGTVNALVLLIVAGYSFYTGNIPAGLIAISGFLGWMRVAQLNGEFK